MKNKRGAALLLFLAVIWLGIMISSGLMVLGKSVARSIRTQNALDAAAVSGANVLAERARIMADINARIKLAEMMAMVDPAASQEWLESLEAAAAALSRGTSTAIEIEIRRVAAANGLPDVQISKPHTYFEKDEKLWVLRDVGPIQLRHNSHRSSSWVESRRGGPEARDWYGRLFARGGR